MNIKYFGVGRADGDIFLKSIPEKGLKSEIKKESGKVFKKMRDFGLNPEERQKISTKNGNWFAKAGENNLLYFVLTDREYPERHAYGMVQIVQDAASKIDSDSFSSDSHLKSQLKPILKDSVKKYEDLKAIDKIAQANATVEEVRVQMETNLKKVMDNQPNIEVFPFTNELRISKTKQIT